MDGSYPSISGLFYQDKIAVPSGETLITAIAVSEEGLVSTVAELNFTITGVVDSPAYIGMDRGTSGLGDGKVDAFVYLPRDYDPERPEPYPFVICNHGNGWTMDGTPQKANWTKRTMYLPADDPDLLNAPDQYTASDDAADIRFLSVRVPVSFLFSPVINILRLCCI